MFDVLFSDDNVRFSKLERLMLDENRLATSEVFAALATLPKYVMFTVLCKSSVHLFYFVFACYVCNNQYS